MARWLSGCVLTFGLGVLLLGGCVGGDGSSALPAEQITAEEQDVVADSLVVIKMMNTVVGVGVAEGTKGASVGKLAKGPKETVTETIDVTVDLSTVDPNASGTVNVVGSITTTSNLTSASGSGSVTITTGAAGVSYTDPVSGDSATVTITSPGITIALSVSGQLTATSLSASGTASVSYSGLDVSATVDGRTLAATVSESWTASTSISATQTTLDVTAALVGYKAVDFTVDGESHSVRLDLNLSASASGSAGGAPQFAMVNVSIVVTVDGVAYAYNVQQFAADYGEDFSLDGGSTIVTM